MSTVSVQLSESALAIAEQSARQFGLNSPSEYIAALLDNVEANRREIETQLLEGLESGTAEPWTEGDWKAVLGQSAGS